MHLPPFQNLYFSMQLTAQNIIRYLADEQWVTDESALNGELCWYPLRSRNQVFIVEYRLGKGLFLKQAVESPERIKKEVAVQHILHHFSDFDEIRIHLPDFYGFDEYRRVLVFEHLAQARTILETTELRKQQSQYLAEKMAHVLAGYHIDLTRERDTDPTLLVFDRALPWILKLPNTQDYAREVVLEQIKQDDFLLQHLDAAARQWSCSSLIDGDINLKNFMLQTTEQGDCVKLVDWEMANLGDPLWDLAGLMQAYVAAGLRYSRPDAKHYELTESKQFWSKDAIRTMWSRIWATYASKMSWDEVTRQTALGKLIGFMAARLLQSAAELNRISPEFLAPGAWAMIAEARSYFKHPGTLINIFNTSAGISYEA